MVVRRLTIHVLQVLLLREARAHLASQRYAAFAGLDEAC